ncbi:hypothetical protein Pmar_PMAR005322 [Perkinsus marinus ATCC 50983]|uniref:Uncharacterized protein n=1 Tax=Perkinsus marinus (strain ATCC 50983 / TXsc) TaxID=423536 RepID=C5KB85_PERM5|nr:hypothetical protein Pmar_PMAR005322 [Perkinsus marinus ATCC 50983]EER18411.1 hypothetical protein Pmar_PMAR005322 [Perkinsus marinus ATCC 50983]|eukprot:XP_002786615.1 hypothetical protein Pmar_PMAR005322 [Perkinsus marinus ATCC 50983]
MDHAWAYSLPNTPTKAAKAVSPAGAAPKVLTPAEVRARASRKRFHVSLVTIVDRWERTCSGGCLKQVRKMAELRRQRSAIRGMATRKTFSPCTSFRVRSVALGNTEELIETARGELNKALHDLALTLEDLHTLCAEYDGEACAALHFATKLEDAYREELSLRRDLVEAMARLEYPENFSGFQRILVVFAELSSTGYSLYQACCAVVDFHACVVVEAGESSELVDRVKARLRHLAED